MRCAIYARISNDELQRSESIDDQIRECINKVNEICGTVEDCHIYQDIGMVLEPDFETIRDGATGWMDNQNLERYVYIVSIIMAILAPAELYRRYKLKKKEMKAKKGVER